MEPLCSCVYSAEESRELDLSEAAFNKVVCGGLTCYLTVEKLVCLSLTDAGFCIMALEEV